MTAGVRGREGVGSVGAGIEGCIESESTWDISTSGLFICSFYSH